jgi:hypothetical protein
MQEVKAAYRFGARRSINFFFGSCDLQMSFTENLKPYNKGQGPEGQVLKKRCDKFETNTMLQNIII